MPASFGVHGPGEMTMCSGLPRRHLFQRDRIVAVHVHVRAQLAEVLDEVVGEAVVVVDQQQHVAAIFMFPIAMAPARLTHARRDTRALGYLRPGDYALPLAPLSARLFNAIAFMQ